MKEKREKVKRKENDYMGSYFIFAEMVILMIWESTDKED